MSSCTNSSNIRSTLLTQIIREESDGKRVAFKVSSADVGISAGVTLGSVVRYDVVTDSYMPSRADNPATAEVIGIVEKVDNGTYTIVASGLMVYPNINQVINSYTGGCQQLDGSTAGGSGGSDIFFLSAKCDGKLQLLEPTTPGDIVKPVMQRVKVGPSGPNQYNGIVLNYIGYQVAELADSTYEIQSAIGGVIYTKDSGQIEGFIDVRNPQIVNVADEPELYSIFGTNHGTFDETVTLDSSLELSSFIGSNAYQKNPNGTDLNSGTIISASTANKTITIRKTNTQAKTDLTKSILVGTRNFRATSFSVKAFTVPSVDTQKITYKTSLGTKEETLIPYMRSKSTVTSVSLPKTLKINQISSDKVTTGGFDVGAKLLDLETRVKNMETRYGIII